MSQITMKKISVYALLCVMIVSFSSCNIYKKYEFPAEESAITSDYQKAVESVADSTSLPYLSWEKVFTDPMLQSLIRTALENNHNLDNARLNVDIARAQLKGAKLSYFPAVSLSPNVNTASYGGSHMNLAYTIPVGVQWEIDAFAKILNKKRGAKVAVEQAEDYRQAVQSQIVCSVASCYYNLVLLNQQLALTKRTSEIWKDQVETMQLLKDAGQMNEAAVVQSRANYYSILSTLPDLENSIHQVQNVLSLLLNTYPQEWKVTDSTDIDMPAEVAAGVPISYLAVRPDVRAAERGLASAYYNTTSARAAFYPSLVISSNGGFTNLLGSIISNPGKWFIQLAGQLTAPLFQRGQRIASLEAAKLQQQQALNNFEVSVLTAASEVSDALTAYRTNAEKREYLMKQIDQLEKSVEISNELLAYNRSTTYLEVLTAQSSLLNAQMSSLQCWHGKVAALISLYQAVGGGR